MSYSATDERQVKRFVFGNSKIQVGQWTTSGATDDIPVAVRRTMSASLCPNAVANSDYDVQINVNSGTGDTDNDGTFNQIHVEETATGIYDVYVRGKG